METLIGQTLGQYRIVGQIGKGGMATVFKAYQPGLDRYVAIKVLPAYYAHEEGFSERFVREARAIARLDHPHILPVYDFGQADGLSYIAMKYVAAGTLKDRLGQPLALEETLEILSQIGTALDHAHDLGILHRDVKPGNILIDEKGWVYLSDFGLAKMVEGSVQLTGSGVGVGTPAYMSPEQGQGLPVDGRTDVYALGIILYEMLTGRVPYEAETPMAVVVKHITSPLPLPRSINPAIPGSVERVVLKALAKDANDRFARAGELVQGLQEAMAQAEPEQPAARPPAAVPPPTPRPRPGPALAGQAPAPPGTAQPPYQAPATAKKSGLPMLALAGAAGLVVVVGIVLVVALILLLRPGGTPGDRTTSDGGGLVTAYAAAPAPVPVGPTTPAATWTPPAESTAQAEATEPLPASTEPAAPAVTEPPAPIEATSPTFTAVPDQPSTFTPTPTATSTPTATPTPTTLVVCTPPACTAGEVYFCPGDCPGGCGFQCATPTPIPVVNPDTGYLPHPVFNAIWVELGGGSGPLGYPTGPAITDRNYARQYFERGFMYWWQSPVLPEPVWVVAMPDRADNSGTGWTRYDNAWDASMPLFPPNCPEAVEPLGPLAGFGVTWCDRPGVKEQVGAPVEREAGSGDVAPKGAVQFFQHGVIFESPRDRQVWALVEGLGWRRAGY